MANGPLLHQRGELEWYTVLYWRAGAASSPGLRPKAASSLGSSPGLRPKGSKARRGDLDRACFAARGQAKLRETDAATSLETQKRAGKAKSNLDGLRTDNDNFGILNMSPAKGVK